MSCEKKVTLFVKNDYLPDLALMTSFYLYRLTSYNYVLKHLLMYCPTKLWCVLFKVRSHVVRGMWYMILRHVIFLHLLNVAFCHCHYYERFFRFKYSTKNCYVFNRPICSLTRHLFHVWNAWCHIMPDAT